MRLDCDTAECVDGVLVCAYACVCTLACVRLCVATAWLECRRGSWCRAADFTLEFHTFTHCCFSFIGAMGLYMYMFGYVKQFNLHRFSKLRTLFSIIEIVLASILRCQDHQHDHNVCDVWQVKMSKITIVLVLRNNITYHMNTYLIAMCITKSHFSAYLIS